MTIRWAKGAAGSGPRRRTVLTVPEFEWVVDLLRFWIHEGGRDRLCASESTRNTHICAVSRSRGEQAVHLTDALLQPLDRAHAHDSLHVLAGLEPHAQVHARAALVLEEPN